MTIDELPGMIAMRDDAFADLGDAAPAFTVDSVTTDPNPFSRRRIEGTFELPLFLTNSGQPGAHGAVRPRPARPPQRSQR